MAVLPFRNVGSDPSLDHLRLALPDETATALSHASGLAARPFATTREYDPANLDLPKAGRETGVSGIVTGHFMKDGEQLRVTLEAVDVETNEALWRDKVGAPAHSMVATQVQSALRVQGGLAPAFGAPVTKSRAPPKNEEAYDLFLRGKALAFDRKSGW